MAERRVVDHVVVGVTDIERSRRFYSAALAPLGFEQIGGYLHGGYAFGPPGLDDFIVSDVYEPGGRIHVAFAAESRREVDAFHAAAVAAGGTDNGAPGIRPDYSPGYYGAFVLDPDGHNVEAVFHEPT